MVSGKVISETCPSRMHRAVGNVLPEMQVTAFPQGRSPHLQQVRLQERSREEGGAPGPRGEHGDASDDGRRVLQMREQEGLLGAEADAGSGRTRDADIALHEMLALMARVLRVLSF